MRIIFLDFDGVMDTASYCQFRVNQGLTEYDEYGTVFDPDRVNYLKQIIDKTGAKIVVSSSWKSIMPFEELLDMWEKRGLPGEVIDTTPYTLGCRNRGDEIDSWLLECKEGCQYVIIDDIDESNFNEHQSSRLVVVDPVQGLNEEAARKAIKILYDEIEDNPDPLMLSIDDLREGLTLYCALLGIDQSTCLALVLMMHSKELLLELMKYMAQIEVKGLKKKLSKDEITTMVVNEAARLRDAVDKRESKKM